MGEEAQINYCRHCGRGVATTKEKCMYCAGLLRRGAAFRRCPFCAEKIRTDAAKCRFCGEFVDGRERPPEAGPHAQPAQPAGPTNVQIFMIDKALMNTSEDVMVQGGMALPTNVAGQLPPQAVRAIEANRPDLLPPGEVKALPAPAPAPEEPGVVDVEARPVTPGEPPADEPRVMLPPPDESGPSEWESIKAMLSDPSKTKKEKALFVGKRVGLLALKYLRIVATKLGIASWVFLKWSSSKSREKWTEHQQKKAEAKAAAAREAGTASAEEKMAAVDGRCPGCGVEVHPLDMFCYHCGRRIGKGIAPFDEEALPERDTPTTQWAWLALVFGLFGWVPAPVPALPRQIPIAALGLLCGIVALLRIHQPKSRLKGNVAAILGILLAGVWLVTIFRVQRGEAQIPFIQRFWQGPQAEAPPDPQP